LRNPGLWHAALNDRDALRQIGGGLTACVGEWARKNRCKPSSLVCVERLRRNSEVMARRGLRAKDALAPLRDIEIQLEDPALGHRRLEHPGDCGFLALARPRALPGE